jgi:hypothetical protein
METKENKKGLQDFKKKRDSAPRRSLQDILQQGALVHHQGTLAQPANQL